MILWALGALCLWRPLPLGAQGADFTAEEVFLRLPAALLDNLGEGLNDYEKFEILSTGRAGAWALRSSFRDSLELDLLSDPETTVALCLYRGERGLVVAMGTDFGPLCLTELWRMEKGAGPASLDPPRDPSLRDFFQRDRRISADISVSMTFCVRPEGLEVKPQFWSPSGRASLRPDNAVFYIWTGTRFSKRIVPLYN